MAISAGNPGFFYGTNNSLFDNNNIIIISLTTFVYKIKLLLSKSELLIRSASIALRAKKDGIQFIWLLNQINSCRKNFYSEIKYFFLALFMITDSPGITFPAGEQRPGNSYLTGLKLTRTKNWIFFLFFLQKKRRKMPDSRKFPEVDILSRLLRKKNGGVKSLCSEW